MSSQIGYRWIITKDRISEPDEKNYVGTQGPYGLDESLKDNPQHFSLYDDDGICYAEGMLYSTDEEHNGEVLFAPLWEFGQGNWGCAYIKVNGEIV